jgi:RNA polymerase sigma factor (sigma-70 family)
MAPDEMQDLVLRAKAGDGAAWARLDDHVRPYLARKAAALVGPGWAHRSGSDLVQDTLARAWAEFAHFRGADGPANTAAVLRAWLVRIMGNLHRNGLRHDGADRRSAPGLLVPLAGAAGPDGSSGLDPPAGDPSPSTDAARAEAGEHVAAALARLDPEDRALVDRYYFLGQSMRQIADELGLTEDRVRYRLKSVLARLGDDLRGWA